MGAAGSSFLLTIVVVGPEAILHVTLVLHETLVTLVLKVVETTALPPLPPFPPFYLVLDLEAAPFLPPPLVGVSA